MTPFQLLTKFTMKYFPLPYGHDRLKEYLAPVPLNVGMQTTKLRGHDLKISYDPYTYMGWMLYYRGTYEQAILETCHALLENGMNFADVGANYGLYTLVAAQKVGDRGKVLSIEPQKQLVPIIEQNIKRNQLRNVTLLNTAAGCRNSTSQLFRPSLTNDGQATLMLGSGECSFGESETVSVKTLDELLTHCKINHLDGLKVDVEGAELTVLEGLQSQLRRDPPSFMFLEIIESHLARFGHTPQSVFSFLQDFRYRLAGYSRGRWINFSNADEFRKNTRASSDVLAIHPTYRNSKCQTLLTGITGIA